MEGLDIVPALDAMVVFFGTVIDGEHASDAFVEIIFGVFGGGDGGCGGSGRA